MTELNATACLPGYGNEQMIFIPLLGIDPTTMRLLPDVIPLPHDGHYTISSTYFHRQTVDRRFQSKMERSIEGMKYVQYKIHRIFLIQNI